MAFQTILLPLSSDDPRNKTFRYEGYDIITLQKEVERDYKVPEPQTAQEVIGYYARRIAEKVKLPSQFAALAPRVREFFEHKAFGHYVDMQDHMVVRAMSTPVAHYVCVDVFEKALKKLTIVEQEPQLLEPARMLSNCVPFPWSRPVWQGTKTVFNLVPCDNQFEREFARFLDNAPDVAAFSKLPQPFGFSIDYTDSGVNLRSYYPDFVAVDNTQTNWILETKGAEDIDVTHKDSAAMLWCEKATQLTGTKWEYLKVAQKAFEALQPSKMEHLIALKPFMQKTLP
jgi:type III restriction enzyme